MWLDFARIWKCRFACAEAIAQWPLSQQSNPDDGGLIKGNGRNTYKLDNMGDDFIIIHINLRNTQSHKSLGYINSDMSFSGTFHKHGLT